MANIIGLNIRKAANTTFFKSMGEQLKLNHGRKLPSF